MKNDLYKKKVHKGIRQVKQEIYRQKLEKLGIPTWSVYLQRDVLIQMIYAMCWKVNPKHPIKFYKYIYNQYYRELDWKDSVKVTKGARNETGHTSHMDINGDEISTK